VIRRAVAPTTPWACRSRGESDIVDIKSVNGDMRMAQLIVRNLEEGVKRRLQRRAQRSGRSLEAEVREILRAAAANISPASFSSGFGTRFSAYFGKAGTDLEPFGREETEAPEFE
jgi:antitoxin FitA